VTGETMTFVGSLATLRLEFELRDQLGAPGQAPVSLFQNPPAASDEAERRVRLDRALRATVDRAFGDADVDVEAVKFQGPGVAAQVEIATSAPLELAVSTALAAVAASGKGIERPLRRYVQDFSTRNGGPPRVSITERHLLLAGSELGTASASDTSFGKAAGYAIVILLAAVALAAAVDSFAEYLA
jgi:hypothetical protein